MSCWEASALVKLYAKEPDSPAFENQARNAPTQPVISRIGLFEARATFHRKEAEGILKPGAAQTLYQQLALDAATGNARLIGLGPDVEQEYGQVLSLCSQRTPPILLRTLDVLHLAPARVAGETEMVATDKRLRELATLLGFSLYPT